MGGEVKGEMPFTGTRHEARFRCKMPACCEVCRWPMRSLDPSQRVAAGGLGRCRVGAPGGLVVVRTASAGRGYPPDRDFRRRVLAAHRKRVRGQRRLPVRELSVERNRLPGGDSAPQAIDHPGWRLHRCRTRTELHLHRRDAAEDCLHRRYPPPEHAGAPAHQWIQHSILYKMVYLVVHYVNAPRNYIIFNKGTDN